MKQLKLLVADDEDIIRRGIVKYIILHTERFVIYEAKNGQEAIDLLVKYHPEIMLLDVQMPLKDGIEVMQAAKNAGINPVTIILSGYDEFKYAQQAIRYGAKEYLLKPLRASDILKCLNDMADKYIDTVESDDFIEEGEQKNYFIQIAKEYIEEHCTEDISLTDVAEAAGISSGYLSTMFSQYEKCNFVDYLNKVRIEMACCYLEQKNLKNYEIAYKIGFHDEKYFSKVFKKIKGVTPREYRNGKKSSSEEGKNE